MPRIVDIDGREYRESREYREYQNCQNINYWQKYQKYHETLKTVTYIATGQKYLHCLKYRECETNKKIEIDKTVKKIEIIDITGIQDSVNICFSNY